MRLYITKEEFRSLYAYFSKGKTLEHDDADDANEFPFGIGKTEYTFFKQFYSEHKDMLEEYCDMYEELKDTKKSEEIRGLKERREDLKKNLEETCENETKLILIRKRMVHTEDLLKLYEHSK